MAENEGEKDQDANQGKGIAGLGQVLLGQIEEIGGILTADPMTRAEGEFNIEVGEIKEDLEDAEKEED